MNSFDPNQDGQNDRLDMDPNRFDTLIVFLKELYEKVNFEKNQQTTKKHENYPACKELKVLISDLLNNRVNYSSIREILPYISYAWY